jgi:acetyl-CoA carboxylase carboxyl transferase subunit beta
MAWFRKEKKPREPRRDRLEIPADVWEKCEACGHTDIRENFERNMNVCPNCDYHRRIRANDYCSLLLDEGTMEEVEVDLRSVDPLGFPDYPQRLKKAIAKAGDTDALLACTGTLDALPVNIGVMDFAFMGGSMGSVVGEKVTRVFERALERQVPAIVFSASGGARMQEGVLSLMQMAKTSAALGRLREAGLPYFSVLLHPTTGGVAASFAMLGDVILAEPKALIGFAGARVIQNTIRQRLPPGFQRAEFLLEHGFLDKIVHRRELRGTLARLVRMLGPRAH